MLSKWCGALAGIAALAAAAGAWAADAPPLEAYGKLPSVELMRLSPSGERFATIADVAGNRQLVVATTKGEPLLAAPLSKAKVRSLIWASEKDLLVVTSATVDLRSIGDEKREMDLVLDVNLDTKAGRVVFDHQPSVAKTVMGVYGAARVKDHRYGYFGGITFIKSTAGGDYALDHGWPDLYRVDLESGAIAIVAKGDDQIGSWATSADGQVVARSSYDQKSGRWRLFAGDSPLGRTLVDRVSPERTIGLIGLGRTPGTVLIVDNTGDRSDLQEIPLAGGAPVSLLEDKTNDQYLFDPESMLFIGAVSRDEVGAVFFDPALQGRWAAVKRAFPKAAVKLESYTSGLKRMIVRTEGDGDPGTFYLVDLDAHSASQLGIDRPDIPPEAVGRTSLIHYKAADGLDIDAVLTLPPGKEPKGLPVVVMPHGGPIDFRDDVGFDWWAQAFASRGYAVLQPNYRGSGGRDVAFRQAGYGEWAGKMQTDISDGLKALSDQGVVDPKRACIVGASFGGYAALYGVTMQHGLYRCAVSVAGPSDMKRFFDASKGLDGRNAETRYWRKVTGADVGGDKVMKAISPVNFAANADAPILLIQGRDDTVVPQEQSQVMASALKSAGKPYQLVMQDGEDHWLSREEARVATLKESVAFVQKHNPAD